MAHANSFEVLSGRNTARTLIVGAFLTALTMVGAEKVATDRDRRTRSRKARIISRIKDEGRPIYIMPGCRADGEYIGEMLGPHLEHIGTRHDEAYADNDFDVEELKRHELETRARDMGRAAIVYCSSMGGMKFTHSLADPDYREKFGKIDTLILDSSPASISDLDSGTRFAMFASRVLPPSWTISRLYRSFMMKKVDQPRRHSPRVTDEQVRGHILSSANTPLLAVRNQAEFIRSTHLSAMKDGELAGVADNIYYISSTRDHVVNTDSAFEEYNRIYGGTVKRYYDMARDESSHADGPENPELIIQLMEGNPPTEEELQHTHAVPSFVSAIPTTVAA